MASKTKQKKSNKEEKRIDSDSSSDSRDDDNNDEKYNGNEVIQVEFEGRNPINGDFHGIRQLLQQLFLKSEINLSEMSDIITDQNFIGSVVIQSFVDESSDDDDDDNPEFDSTGTIFGITTAVNISKHFASGCIDGLRKYLLTKCDQFATPDVRDLFKSVLNDESKRAGFLINERFVNIPPQISVPLLENLNKEVNRAAVKQDKFSFTHYVMLVKLHRKDPKKCKDAAAIEDVYSNGEEEILCEQCDASFEYSVQSETDSALSGHWLEGDSTLIPFRKVVLFESKKLLPIIESIKEVINE